MPKLPPLAALAAVLTLATPARAVTVFSETFDDAAFAGSLAYSGYSSDRWARTSYYRLLSAHGWIFSGGDYLAVNDDDKANRALLLNEGGNSARITVSGLTAGTPYVLRFLQWGDSVPGSGYSGGVLADGASILSFSGVDMAPGTNAGTLRTAGFTAASTSVTLTFFESSRTDASPIIDDIVVSDLPEPASAVLLLLGGFLAAAYRSQRRSRSAASATSASGAQ